MTSKCSAIIHSIGACNNLGELRCNSCLTVSSPLAIGPWAVVRRTPGDCTEDQLRFGSSHMKSFWSIVAIDAPRKNPKSLAPASLRCNPRPLAAVPRTPEEKRQVHRLLRTSMNYSSSIRFYCSSRGPLTLPTSHFLPLRPQIELPLFLVVHTLKT